MKLVKDKIIGFLRQGMTPRDLALALALGVTLGTFPVIGATSMLCVAASVLLRLNLPTIQSVNWAVSPLQLTLLIPLFKLGSVLFGGATVTVSLTTLIAMMQTNLIGTIREFLIVTVHGIGAWVLVAVPAAAFVYLFTLPLITRVHAQYARIRDNDEVSQQPNHRG
jgi:hypothetical protein